MAERETKVKAAEEAYGQVPSARYRRLVEESTKDPAQKLLLTFREDFQLGTDSRGVFTVRYRGECSDCGLEYEFKHEARIFPE